MGVKSKCTIENQCESIFVFDPHFSAGNRSVLINFTSEIALQKTESVPNAEAYVEVLL